MTTHGRKDTDWRRWLIVGQALAFLLIVGGVYLAGCSANDPFDPESVENIKPVVRMSMTPVDTSTSLEPTSYFNRTFHWSATDPDGWVVEFHVAILTSALDSPVWTVTTRTDTTMSFETDSEGNAEAIFLLACRDNRDAMSDTLEQVIPLRNFPPNVGFRSDFDPLRNLQRELRDINGDITENPSEAADTTYWNWGPMNFRMFALDLDGAETMDEFYRYTLVDTALGDPEETYWDWEEEADPTVNWVKSLFPASGEIKEFDLFLPDAPAGMSTLTVAVNDEADSDTRFHYTWEVREPSGPVLYIPDNSGPNTKVLYREFLAQEYGENGWDEYNFWFGYPDNSFVLVESMRKFQAVLWADGGSTSPRLEEATQTAGALEQYLTWGPTDDRGRLLLISKGVVGSSSSIPFPFLKNILGINPTPSPVSSINTVAGKSALGLQPYLPDLTSTSGFGQAVGLNFPTETDIPWASPLYQMEECLRCYGNRPPWDPIVGMRFPDYDTSALASAVTISLQLEYFDSAQVLAGLSAILSEELGVTSP